MMSMLIIAIFSVVAFARYAYARYVTLYACLFCRARGAWLPACCPLITLMLFIMLVLCAMLRLRAIIHSVICVSAARRYAAAPAAGVQAYVVTPAAQAVAARVRARAQCEYAAPAVRSAALIPMMPRARRRARCAAPRAFIVIAARMLLCVTVAARAVVHYGDRCCCYVSIFMPPPRHAAILYVMLPLSHCAAGGVVTRVTRYRVRRCRAVCRYHASHVLLHVYDDADVACLSLQCTQRRSARLPRRYATARRACAPRQIYRSMRAKITRAA